MVDLKTYGEQHHSHRGGGGNVSTLNAACPSVMYSMCVGHKVYFGDVIYGLH